MATVPGCQSPPPGRNQPKTINVNRWRRQFEILARVRDQDQVSKVGAGDTSSKETILEQNVSFEAEGSIYHPNLMEFSLMGLFGLLQEDFEGDFDRIRRRSADTGDVIEFDVEGRFLKKKPFPGMVFANRRRELQPRPFLSSLETTSTNYGFNWQFVSARTPTRLQFSDSETVLNPLDDREKDSRQKNTALRFNTEYRITDRNILALSYDHEAVDIQPFELIYESDELTLTHQFQFGAHQLDSEIVYFDQTGTFDVRRWRWRETLRLQHTENVRSWIQTELADRTQGTLAGVEPLQESSFFISGRVEHELYESLVSELFVFAHWQEFGDGLTIQRTAIQPSFDYRKKNPWGVLLCHYTFRIQKEDREGGDQTVEVLNERGTFTDPEPVVLSNTNVVSGSIFITAEDQVTAYRPGEDYRVRLIGDTVEIERVPTGRIPDGGTVLIDYLYAIGGDFTLDTTIHNLSVRQNFRFGLSPYYTLQQQRQDISPSLATGVQPEDITAHTVGSLFQGGPLRLKAEYESHDSTVNPFEAIRLSASLTHNFSRAGTARVRVRWSDIDRSGRQDRQTEFLTVEGAYRQRIGEYLVFEGTVLYRDEDDSVAGNDRGFDVDLALDFAVRETEMRLTYEMGRYEDDFSQNRNGAIRFQLRRRF